MKTYILFVVLTIVSTTVLAQNLKFKESSPFTTEEKNTDFKITIPIILENIKKDCDLNFSLLSSSATDGKDFVIDTSSPIHLTTAKNIANIEITIKSDAFVELMEEININFTLDNDTKSIGTYQIQIFDQNDGTSNNLVYTQNEQKKLQRISIELYPGQFLEDLDLSLKWKGWGGELVIIANNLVGKDSRFGGYAGVFTYKNFTRDSSNQNVRVEHIRTDTGLYINGKTNYLERTLVDHKLTTVTQAGGYMNLTYRLSKNVSDLFSSYLTFRAEVSRYSTQSEYSSDTVSSETVNRALGNSPVFQSGKGFLLQKVKNYQTNHFYSFGFSFFLNAKDKFRFYFEPTVGLTAFTVPKNDLNEKRTAIIRYSSTATRGVAIFKYRLTEQITGLNLTIGGEFRDVKGNDGTLINAYVGLRANLGAWFNQKTKNQ